MDWESDIHDDPLSNRNSLRTRFLRSLHLTEQRVRAFDPSDSILDEQAMYQQSFDQDNDILAQKAPVLVRKGSMRHYNWAIQEHDLEYLATQKKTMENTNQDDDDGQYQRPSMPSSDSHRRSRQFSNGLEKQKSFATRKQRKSISKTTILPNELPELSEGAVTNPKPVVVPGRNKQASADKLPNQNNTNMSPYEKARKRSDSQDSTKAAPALQRAETVSEKENADTVSLSFLRPGATSEPSSFFKGGSGKSFTKPRQSNFGLGILMEAREPSRISVNSLKLETILPSQKSVSSLLNSASSKLEMSKGTLSNDPPFCKSFSIQQNQQI